LGIQAALEGALSTLANLADHSAEAQRAALENRLAGILVSCLQQALNGAPRQSVIWVFILASHRLLLGLLHFKDVIIFLSTPACTSCYCCILTPLLRALEENYSSSTIRVCNAWALLIGNSTLRMAELAALALRTLGAGSALAQDAAREAGALPLVAALLNPAGSKAMEGERKARKDNAAAAASRAVHALAEGNAASKVNAFLVCPITPTVSHECIPVLPPQRLI
jgi:hypothetical protein